MGDCARDDALGETLVTTAAQIDPREATTLCNYGWLMHQVRHDVRAAEDMYKRALALDPALLSDEEQVASPLVHCCLACGLVACLLGPVAWSSACLMSVVFGA